MASGHPEYGDIEFDDGLKRRRPENSASFVAANFRIRRDPGAT